VRDILPAMLLLGVGGGLSLPALMTLAMSGASTQDAGLASGLVSTSAQVGGALGLAVLATISTGRSQELLVAGASLDSALLGGYHLAFGISAGLVLASIAVAATVVRRTSLFTPAARGLQKAVVRAAGEHPVT
jgi:MFS family permease